MLIVELDLLTRVHVALEIVVPDLAAIPLPPVIQTTEVAPSPITTGKRVIAPALGAASSLIGPDDAGNNEWLDACGVA